MNELALAGRCALCGHALLPGRESARHECPGLVDLRPALAAERRQERRSLFVRGLLLGVVSLATWAAVIAFDLLSPPTSWCATCNLGTYLRRHLIAAVVLVYLWWRYLPARGLGTGVLVGVINVLAACPMVALL